jgi:ribose 5-phosphate isomerase RpiB
MNTPVVLERLRLSLPPPAGPTWGLGQDRPFAWVAAAVRGLQREGLRLQETPAADVVEWATDAAERLLSGEWHGAVLFCDAPELAACVANKSPGVRAASVTTVLQAARATLTLGANLLTVEMPGRTFFEVRQIMRVLFTSRLGCPEAVARVIEGADDANRRDHRQGDAEPGPPVADRGAMARRRALQPGGPP